MNVFVFSVVDFGHLLLIRRVPTSILGPVFSEFAAKSMSLAVQKRQFTGFYYENWRWVEEAEDRVQWRVELLIAVLHN
jgi:hypothetical protein